MKSLLDVLAGRTREIALDVHRQKRGAVYFLILDGEVVYVGQTTNIEQRAYSHLNLESRWGVPKRFDRIVAMDVAIDDLDAYEGALIRLIRPRFNRRAPLHAGRDNEVLAALGLAPHHDENANAREWSASVYTPRTKAS